MTTWIKVLNSMPQHPKVLQAGDRAAWLMVCGLCYSNEHLTDGFIPRHVLCVVAPGVKNPEALARQLVTAELWHEVEGGWRIHDYDDHQRSSEKIREQRSKDAERKASERSPNGQNADSGEDSAGSPTVEKRRVEKRRTKNNFSVEQGSTVRECFAYWQQTCKHPSAKLTADRRSKIQARLKEGYSAEQIRQAIDGAARAAFVNERGKRFDDIELICRNGSKLESFIDRAVAKPGGQLVALPDRRSRVVAQRNRLVQRHDDGGGAA